ncbi:MAG: hypothetical protein A4S09_04220 [Proteobacteria bacterium SG_bin7]|nr:MAG: hypothetical protein A4S09_04220 [Proteobacteria bacterium SG_bin7]
MTKANIFFTLLFCWSASTLAQDRKDLKTKSDSFMNTLSADYLDRDYEKGVINLKGKVNFAFGNKKLSADSAEIWYKSKLIVANGNAEIASDSFAMQGERIEYDYGNDVGNIFNGQVKSGKVTFKGEKLEKKGESDFSADYGVYTACDCDPPTWSFSGHNIDAGVGSYAYVKWPILRVANFPIFALPYIVVPLKSSRQTGLLLPTYESTSEGGSTIGEGFFWAINQSQDSTLTLKNYELRGLKTMLEYRQRYSQNSLFEMNGGYLSDRAVYQIPRYTKNGKIDKSHDRWYFKANQYLELPENYTQRLNLNLASDLQYILDFPQDLGGAGEPALENHYSITKKHDDVLFLLDSTMYTNLLEEKSISNNDDAVHRLPEIRFSFLERPIGNTGFSFKLDSQYVNFARNSLAWDDVCDWGSGDTEGGNSSFCKTGIDDSPSKEFRRKKRALPDGTFSPDYDFLRTGQRLDFQPTISYTFRAGQALDIVPSISYRETYYQFPLSATDFESTFSRRYLQTQISSRFKTYRIYEGKENKIKHEIVPEIMWTNTPLIYQPDHKFFGTRADAVNFRQNQSVTDAQDFYGANKLQFDYNDRIFDRSLVTFMLANKLIRKRVYNNVNDYKQIGTIRLWQTYDFIEASRVRTLAEGTQNKPWSEISSLFDFRFDNFETNSLFKYFPYHNVINTSLRIKTFNNYGNYAEVTYTQAFKISDITTDIDYRTRDESISPRIGFISKYLNLGGGPDYNFVSHNIVSWSADLGIKPPGNCILLGIQIVKPTGDVGVSMTAKFNMSFDGT